MQRFGEEGEDESRGTSPRVRGTEIVVRWTTRCKRERVTPERGGARPAALRD